MERQAAYRDADLAREPRQCEQAFGIAAELARQVADGARVAERDAQQQLGVVGVRRELLHFVGVVGDEHLHSARQRAADVDVCAEYSPAPATGN